MIVTVNGLAVETSGWPSPEVATIRELLRQRAIAIGILSPDVDDDQTISAATERLLADEVSVPRPTEAECRRYYENHLKEFQPGDLVCARHILFQVTPSVSVPEIRARAERALSELLVEPEPGSLPWPANFPTVPQGSTGAILARSLEVTPFLNSSV